MRRRGEPLVEVAQLVAARCRCRGPRRSSTARSPTRRASTTTVRVRRGERGRVVEQLGDQVDQVVDRVRGDLDVAVDHAELDAGVVLDLGLRGAEHVDQGGRLALHAGGVGTGEHQQVFVVTAHPGGQVVELEQLGQPVRVLLAALQPVEVTDEPVDQDLRAAGQVDEHRRDGGPQRGLLGRGADGLEVDRVERLGHLAELVLAAHRQRLGDLVGHLRRATAGLDSAGSRSRATACGRPYWATVSAPWRSSRSERAIERATNQAKRIAEQQHAEQQAGLDEDPLR